MDSDDEILHMRAVLRDKRIPYDVEWLKSGEAIITQHCTAYLLPPGASMRSMPCVICDNPLGGLPLILITMAFAQECQYCEGHLDAVTVARHTNCPAPDFARMAEIIADKYFAKTSG